MDRGAESLLETLARTYFRHAGIRVETQVHIDGVGHVDLLLEGRLIVELDGRHHGEWAQVKKDQRRNNRSVVRGYAVLRSCPALRRGTRRLPGRQLRFSS
ncbi:endonuclease domain-containing protein [Arthrobacter sp. NPDC058130]|uniref:endonuclease domain-containing protein n=1 Tax=Arthrobacter sp. NPDC058130 TaxID=3346353 RepID=UPI0036EE703A